MVQKSFSPSSQSMLAVRLSSMVPTLNIECSIVFLGGHMLLVTGRGGDTLVPVYIRFECFRLFSNTKISELSKKKFIHRIACIRSELNHALYSLYVLHEHMEYTMTRSEPLALCECNGTVAFTLTRSIRYLHHVFLTHSLPHNVFLASDPELSSSSSDSF
jgi:hypothetical protein